MDQLPDAARKEYDGLTIAIKTIEERINGTIPHKLAAKEILAAESEPPSKRIPKEKRKKDLIAWFQRCGPATRGQILSETEIPNGSLGLLLKEPEFERDEDTGKWKLAE